MLARSVSLQTTALAAALLAIGASAAYAQAPEETNQPPVAEDIIPADEPAAQGDEEVIVTGTRLRVRDYQLSAPVQSVTGEQIRQSGTVNLTDYLQQLPSLVNSFDSQDSADTGGQASVGLNLLNLRNLGTSRTLVLVDGRRHVSSDPGSSAVDINTIPMALIERVEVLTGGASAVYGADGVSGVVNFVTRQNFDGLAVRAQIGGPEGRGGSSFLGSTTFGKNFDEGRGNFTVTFETGRLDSVTSFDRRYSAPETRETLVRNPAERNQTTFALVDDPNVYDFVFLRDARYIDTARGGAVFSSFMGPGPAGVDFLGDGTPWEHGLYTSGFVQIGGSGTRLADFVDDLLPGADRELYVMTGNYRFSESFRVFADVKYAHTDTVFVAQPTFNYGIIVELDNPYIPQAILDDASGPDGLGYLIIGRDNFDLGYTNREIDRDTYRTVLGVDGNLTDWLSYEVSFVWGQSKEKSTYRNNRINERWYAAIDAVRDPNTGQIVCRSDLDPTAAPFGDLWYDVFDDTTWGTTFTPGANSGCVPANIFGENVSPEAAAWINTTSVSRAKVEQTVVSGFLSGVSTPWFELPGGPVSFVVGFEYRDESSESLASDIELLAASLGYDVSWAGQGTNTVGGFDVWEGFVEASVPVLADMTLVKELTFDGAYRWSNYSTAGSAEAWKAGVKWRLDDNVMLRGTVATAVRAPNISELFLPNTQTYAILADPCDVSRINLSATRTANCNALGIPPGWTNAASSSVEGRIGGNANLLPEKADTWTVGIVLTPEFIPGLSIAVDHYNITLKDAIQAFSAQTILDKCYDLPQPNPFCDLIQRYPAGTPGGLEYRVSFFEQYTLNVAKYETSGTDFTIRYRLDPQDVFGIEEDIGVFNFAIAGSKLDHLVFTELEDADPDEDAGWPGAPKWQVLFDMNWTFQDLQIRYGFSYFSKTVRIDPRNFVLNPDYIDPKYSHYSERWVHDVQIAYNLTDNVTLYGGINNFTNQEPDRGSATQPVGALGRFYYVGLSVSLDELGF